jgi:AAA15 family ATPase/GTPase
LRLPRKDRHPMIDTLPHNASALLAFRARNNRSFRDEFELSMLATAMAEKNIRRDIGWRAGGKPVGVLPVAGIFGANASGKTNVLRSMDDMRRYVLHSFRRGSPTGGVPHRPFLLDPSMKESESSFEVDLILDGVRHEYGFVIDEEMIREEWALHYPRGRAAVLFQRRGEDVQFGAAERSRSRAVMELLRPNALFLSTAASANHPVLLPLYEWFEHGLLLAETQSRPSRQALTAELLDDPKHREQVLALLQAADIGITGATKEELDAATRDRLQRAMKILLEEAEVEASFDDLDIIRLAHQGVTGDVELHLTDESLGTLVWFGLVGPVAVALSRGAVFLADELDASLHPALVEQLVRLFQDRKTNPRFAQLVFNSHDITILDGTADDRLIGRDQVWFTEKREDGSTHLYPLTDLNPRKDEAIAKRYLAGRYGATPIISRRQFEQIAETITAGDPS